MPDPLGPRLFDGTFSGLERVLDLRRVQHTLVATNLANASTPGFRAREIPFGELLTEVMETAIAGEDPDVDALASRELRELEPLPWSSDQNSVDSEREAVKLAENQLMYTAVADGLNKRLAILRFAASDGRT